MPGILLFCAGVMVGLAASRLVRGVAGAIAALAADTPEIASAVIALSRGQASVGAGVVIGSNVFNLAALLGLAAVVAGWIGFHRQVVVLAGVQPLITRRFPGSHVAGNVARSFRVGGSATVVPTSMPDRLVAARREVWSALTCRPSERGQWACAV